MPKNAAANGAKNSTSVASDKDFIILTNRHDALTSLRRYLWRVCYGARRAIARSIQSRTYALQRRREIAEARQDMRPQFQYIFPDKFNS